MKMATRNLHRYWLTLLVVVLPWCIPLSAQETDEDGQFYLDFAGSAVFPYDPKAQSDSDSRGARFKVGAGFTAAFGYAFKEGFSTEMEWGYQKVGIGKPSENFSQDIPLPLTLGIDGKIKTQFLMGNVYYRYPKWRVSPYVGLGLGAFFHDGAFTSTVTVGNALETIVLPDIDLPIEFPIEPLKTTVAYQDSRFGYQIMGGVSVRVSKRVEFHFGYRYRSSRGEPIDADQIEAGIRFRL